MRKSLASLLLTITLASPFAFSASPLPGGSATPDFVCRWLPSLPGCKY